LYEYECQACRERFEMIQKFSDAAPEKCPKCGKGPVQRLLSSPAIQFKGSGWYITDYSQKGKPPASGSSGAAPDGKDGKGDAAKEGGAGKDAATKSESTKSDSPATTPTKSS
jgi:putative FmdB family regulatory protein